MATSSAPPRTRTDHPARRLPYEARRAQLVEIAAGIVADEGLEEFALEAIAAKAGVTRNLLYHYFPRGRYDVLLAVAEWAGRQLTEGWILDESLPLATRVAGNFERFLGHAMEPSVAWRLTKLAHTAGDPLLDAIVDRYRETMVTAIALNQLRTTDPPPMVRVAIKASIAYGESVLDQAREQGIPRERALQLVAQALASSIQAGVAASSESMAPVIGPHAWLE